jgi:predicted lipoprotein
MRRWITGVFSLVVVGTGLWLISQPPMTVQVAAASTEFSRPVMLQDIATKVIVPGIHDFQQRCEALTQAAEKLEAEPDAAKLKQTQQAWAKACLAWKRIQWLQFGPVKDRAFWSAMSFKPVYPKSIEKIINGTQPITEDYLAEQGAAAKGIYTLEYLLFDLPQGQAAWVGEDGKPTKTSSPRLSQKSLLEGEQAARRRAYVRALAQELATQAKAAKAIIDAPDFVANYVKSGQDSVNLAVNGLLDEMESGVVNVIRLYVDQFANRSLRYEQIEGYAGGLSVRVVEEELAGLEKLYRGADGVGLDDYVKHVNPGLNERLEKRFAAGKAAIKLFRDAPVDVSLVKNYAAMERAHDELHELEIQIKLDVVSSLGVTLLFSSTDGD